MSELKYYTTPGFGEFVYKHLGYNQTVRIGDRIEISGQGGWKMTGNSDAPFEFSKDITEEITQAWENVDTVLKAAGGKGASQVYRVNSYHLGISDEVNAAMKANFEKWMPTHKPIWTEIGVAQLGAPGMRVELEVVAYDPEGAKAAAK